MIRYIAVILLFLLSCKKGNDNPAPARTIDKSLIYGWWYNDVTKSQHSEYKGRYFDRNGTMLADATNFGLGIGVYGGGTWSWSGATILLSGAGSVKFCVTRLDTDSLHADLIGASPGNTYKMFYAR